LKQSGIKIEKVFDIGKEMFLVQAKRTVDMSRYGKKGFKDIPIEIYMTKTGDTLVTGNVMDSKGRPLTKKLSLAPNKDLEAFSVGTGKNDIYVF